MASPKDLIEYVYSSELCERRQADLERYQIMNGKIREYILKAIKKEFYKEETVKELAARTVPLNLVQKVVSKLAGVYRDTPVRKPKQEDLEDEESIEALSEILDIDTKMKWANKLVKLCKRVALEAYVTSKGEPALRVLPSHTYTQYSEDDIDPENPTHTIKHLKITPSDKKQDRHIVWSEDEHYLMNGEGAVLENYGNDYGFNPIVEIKEGPELLPIPNDDLLYLEICICLLMTDLAFASKYLSWGVIYTIGVDTKEFSFNPNSLISLGMPKGDIKPEIGVITPKVDTDGMLRQVETLISLLLTTNNLSVGNVSIRLEGGSIASGAAKIIDQAESTEDQKDQQAMFRTGEVKLWNNIARQMDYWASKNIVNASLIYKFSPEFSLSITFQNPTPQLDDKTKIETEKLRMESKLGTQEMALRNLYPDKSDQEISDLLDELGPEETNVYKTENENQRSPSSKEDVQR